MDEAVIAESVSPFDRMDVEAGVKKMPGGKRTITMKQTNVLKEMLFKLENALENKSNIQASLALDLANFIESEGHKPKPSKFVKPENEEKRKKGNVHGNSTLSRGTVGNSHKKPVGAEA